MPIFAALFSGLAVFIGKLVSEVLVRRLVVIAAVLSVLSAFVVAFYIATVTAIGAISAVAPPGLNQAASLVVPDNVPLLISALITARIARWVYEWNVKVVQWRL